MEDKILTEHFKLSEFVNSTTAARLHIDNTPSEEIVYSLRKLCKNVLEPFRIAMNVPITISSGYRSSALNKALGGVKDSQHQYGEAADIHIPDEKTGHDWFVWIMNNLQFDCLIWERNTPKSTHHWIHVSFREGHCRQRVIRNLTKYQK